MFKMLQSAYIDCTPPTLQTASSVVSQGSPLLLISGWVKILYLGRFWLCFWCFQPERTVTFRAESNRLIGLNERKSFGPRFQPFILRGPFCQNKYAYTGQVKCCRRYCTLMHDHQNGFFEVVELIRHFNTNWNILRCVFAYSFLSAGPFYFKVD